MSEVMVINVLNSGWMEIQLDDGRTIDTTANKLNSWLETASRWGLTVTDCIRYENKDYTMILNRV